MSTLSKTAGPRARFDLGAYQFVYAALKYTQQKLGRGISSKTDDEQAHISGRELLDGIRRLANDKFGLMALTVFRQWGVESTADFGRIVFEMIESGEMCRTDRDTLEDFYNVYEFADAFDRDYRLDLDHVFAGCGR